MIGPAVVVFFVGLSLGHTGHFMTAFSSIALIALPYGNFQFQSGKGLPVATTALATRTQGAETPGRIRSSLANYRLLVSCLVGLVCGIHTAGKRRRKGAFKSAPDQRLTILLLLPKESDY